MSKSAVKISLDLLSNPLCEQDQDFLNMVTALDTAMKRMDAFNQEKVSGGLALLPSQASVWVECLCGVLNGLGLLFGRLQALRGASVASPGISFPALPQPTLLPMAHSP